MSAWPRTSRPIFFFLVGAVFFGGSGADLFGPRRASALPSPRLLRAPAQRIVSFDPPAVWERAPTPPSSRLLATWAHRDTSRLTVAAQRVGASADAGKIFDESRASLEQQGWVVGHVERSKPGGTSSKVTVDAEVDNGKRAARQLYLVDHGFVYVVTVVSPRESAAARLHDFDAAVETLKLGEPDKP